MKFSLLGEMKSVGEIDGCSIHGRAGAGEYWLLITLKTNIHPSVIPPEGSYTSQIQSYLRLPDTQLVASGVCESPPAKWFPHTKQLPFLMHRISGAQLAALEDFRNGGDLKLIFRLNGFCSHPEVGGFSGESEFVILQQDWLRILSEAGYRNSVLIELPITEDINSKALVYLESARKFLLRGDYRDSVAKCREALEAAGLPPEKFIIAIEKKPKKERTFDERLVLARSYIHKSTHIAHHPNEEVVTRSQANSVFGMTISTLAGRL